VLRYVDETRLAEAWKQYVRHAVPAAAILLSAGFFFSVISPDATRPSAFVYLAFAGAVVLGVALLALGVGLLRART
jgi:hypothetical protein